MRATITRALAIAASLTFATNAQLDELRYRAEDRWDYETATRAVTEAYELYESGSYIEAAARWHRSLDAFVERNDYQTFSTVAALIGKAFESMARAQEAAYYYKLAEEAARKGGHGEELATALTYRATLFDLFGASSAAFEATKEGADDPLVAEQPDWRSAFQEGRDATEATLDGLRAGYEALDESAIGDDLAGLRASIEAGKLALAFGDYARASALFTKAIRLAFSYNVYDSYVEAMGGLRDVREAARATGVVLGTGDGPTEERSVWRSPIDMWYEDGTLAAALPFGSADGASVGDVTEIYALWMEGYAGTGSIVFSARIVETNDLTSKVEIYNYDRETLGRPLSIVDGFEFAARRPASELDDPLVEAARYYLALSDVNMDPLYYAPALDETVADSSTLARLYGFLMFDCRETSYLIDVSANETFAKKAESGIFAGKNLKEAFKETTRTSLALFFSYVVEYAGDYLLMRYRLNEVYATWLLAGAPLSKRGVEYLVEAPGDFESRLEVFDAYKDDFKDNYYIWSPARDAYEEASEDYSAATMKLDRLQTLAERYNLADELGQVHFQRARALYDLDRFSASAEESEKAISNYLAAGNREAYGSAMHNYGMTLEELNRNEDAIAAFDTAIVIREEALAANATSGNYASLGSSVWGKAYSMEQLDRIDESVELYRLAAEYYDSAGSDIYLDEIRTLTNNVAIVYENWGRYAEAIPFYQRSLDMSIKLGKREAEATATRNVAFNLFEVGEYRNAVNVYFVAFDKFMALGDTSEACYSMSNLGQAYWNLGMYDSAAASHREALELRRASGDVEGQGYSLKKLASLHGESGDAGKAIDIFEEAIELYRRTADTVGLANVYQEIGKLHKTVRNFEKMRESFERAIELKAATADKGELGETYFEYGLALYDFYEYDEAKEYLRKSYELRRELGDLDGQVYCQVNLAMIAYSIDYDYKGAEESFKEALALSRETRNQSNVAYSLWNLGKLYSNMGDNELAIAYYDSSLALYEKLNEVKRISSLNMEMGYAYSNKGMFEKAREIMEKSMEYANSSNDKESQATAMIAISDVQSTLGEFEEAKKSYLRAGEIYRSVDNPWGVASVALGLGNLANRAGDYREAMTRYLEADSLYAALDAEYSRATPVNNIGTIYFWQGDYDPALRQFREALAILDSLGLANDFTTLLKSNVGEVYYGMGEYEKAERWLRESAEMGRESGARRQLGTTLTILGAVETAMERYDDAKRTLDEAYALTTEMGEKDQIVYASLNSGKRAYLAEDYDEAKARLDSAVAISKRTGYDKFLYEALYYQALLLKREGDLRGAIDKLREAADVIEDIRGKLVGGEQAAKLFAEGRTKARVYETLVSSFIEIGEIDSAFHYLERSANEALMEQFGSLDAKFEDEEKQEQVAEGKDLKKKVKGLEAALQEEKAKPENLRNEGKIATLEQNKIVAENSYLQFVNETVRDNPEMATYFTSVNPRSFLREKRNIPEDVAVLAYLTSENQLYVFTATSDSVSAVVVEADRREIESAVVRLYRDLKDSYIPTTVGAVDPSTLKPLEDGREMEYAQLMTPTIETSATLYDRLVRPVAASLEGKTKVAIIPYGNLHYLPFEALINMEDGEFKGYFGEEYSVFYLSSLSALFAFYGETHEAMKIAAFGNADNTLPNAEKEALALKDIYADATIYVRDEATEAKVKKMAAPINAIHFATHGTLDYRNIQNSYLTLAAGDAADDGRLTIEEVWALTNLNGYRLVTLSACKTAVSEELTTGWLVNPANAFFDVGVETVIASLWQVDDAATALLMEKFYDNLSTMGKADALRAAKASLASDPKYAYPYYWAPFVLIGDYR